MTGSIQLPQNSLLCANKYLITASVSKLDIHNQIEIIALVLKLQCFIGLCSFKVEGNQCNIFTYIYDRNSKLSDCKSLMNAVPHNQHRGRTGWLSVRILCDSVGYEGMVPATWLFVPSGTAMSLFALSKVCIHPDMTLKLHSPMKHPIFKTKANVSN